MSDVTSSDSAPDPTTDPAAPTAPAPTEVEGWVLADVAYGRYHNPHEVLGAHVGQGAVTVRTVRKSWTMLKYIMYLVKGILSILNSPPCTTLQQRLKIPPFLAMR